MPIIELQRRLTEQGRIRIGNRVVSSNGQTRPAKLETFRFTSRERSVIQGLEVIYGGHAGPWSSPDGPQFELISETDEITCSLLPADMAMTQWYEDWTGAVARHRCDGQWDTVTDTACTCDPEARTCKMTTRLNVILTDLPGLGTWRLETHGYYAASELAGAVELIGQIASGRMVPIRLRLEQRSVKRLVGAKVETRRFAVPVIQPNFAVGQLLSSAARPAPMGPEDVLAAPVDETPVALDPAPQGSAQAGWAPVPAGDVPPEWPTPSIADQLAEIDKPKKVKPRKNAAQPIAKPPLPSPGADPRICHLCGAEYGSTALVRNRAPEGGRYVHAACAEAMETPDPQASQGQDVGAEEARVEVAPSGPASAPAVTRMTTPMTKMMFSLVPQVLPAPEGTSGAHVDHWRQAQVLAMCGALGTDGLESRRDIDFETGKLLIDALQRVVDGTLIWDGQAFIEPTEEP